jgi:hypothetical protein
MKKDIEFQQLIVNPENYRFDPVDNQGEAIDLMLEEKGEEIFNLAKHILDNGLDKAKDSRVVEIKKDLFLVLDGNRRVTAIKCLHDPSIVKDGALRSRFLDLRKGKQTPPIEINCFVYTDEKDAAEWIKLDHTGKNSGVGQDPWEPAGKDRFDYKFSGKISPAMQIVTLFQQETQKQVDTKTLKISTINRILSNPESRSYLGVDVKNGKVVLVAAKKDVITRLDQLFNKIIVDDIAVKEVYHTPDSIRFMRNLFSGKPKASKVATPVSVGGVVRPGHAVKSVPRSAARNVLIPNECILQIHESKINNMYHELRSVPLDVGTNAVAVLFRVFLETSLDYYATKNGITFGPQTKLSGKITKVTDALEKKNIATAGQLINIRKVATKGNSILSIDNFHEYVHSFTVQPAPVDLCYKWDNLRGFFEILWGDIATKSSKGKKTP